MFRLHISILGLLSFVQNVCSYIYFFFNSKIDDSLTEKHGYKVLIHYFMLYEGAARIYMLLIF